MSALKGLLVSRDSDYNQVIEEQDDNLKNGGAVETESIFQTICQTL